MAVSMRQIVTALTLVVCLATLPGPGWPRQPQPPAPPPPPQQPSAQPQPVRIVEVRGNRRVPAERILAVTETKVGEPVSEQKIRADVRAINELGFFADVNARTETERDGVRVVFFVTENPAVSAVVVDGNTVISSDEIRNALGVSIGEVLNLGKLRDGARAVQKLYEDRGYILARVADLGILPADGPVDEGRLRVRVVEGTVEGIRFEGVRKTRMATIQRHITETRVGVVFNVNRLNRDLQRLFDTGLFESIRARPTPGATLDHTVIVVEIKEALTAQVSGGLGYSSRDGLLGFVELRDRNWQGRGQTFALRAERGIQQGSQRFNYEVSFTEPFFDPRRTALDLSLFSRSTVEREFSGSTVVSRFELLRTGSQVGLSRPLDPLMVGSLRLKSEMTEITALPLDPNVAGSPVVPPSFLSPGRVVSLQLGAIRDSRNDRFAPTAGSKLGGTIELGLQALGGDFGFTKYSVEYQHFFPAGRESTIVGRVFAGTASGLVPVQEQFLLGGPGTVRAFPTGRFRGNSLLVANVEYRFPLGAIIRQLADVQTILFVDAGNTAFQFTDLKVGYGAGIAVKTPVGPIRIDFAFGPEGQQTWLSLGAPF